MLPPNPKDPRFWCYVAQAFVGLFFIVAAYFKLTESFFGTTHVPLAQVFDFWLEQGFPLSIYGEFMVFIKPYANVLAALTIGMQAIAGVLLVYNAWTRIAGAVLFGVQANIFLATFNHRGFNVFVGTSLWLSLFYLLRLRLADKRWWLVATLILIFIDALYLHTRYIIGDPWLSTFDWQFAHYKHDVMSVSPMLKHIVVSISSTPIGPYLWAGAWWLHAALLVGMLTRRRLYFGSAILVLLLVKTILWVNTIGSEGVLWTLTMFTWVTQEEWMTKTKDKRRKT